MLDLFSHEHCFQLFLLFGFLFSFISFETLNKFIVLLRREKKFQTNFFFKKNKGERTMIAKLVYIVKLYGFLCVCVFDANNFDYVDIWNI